jgi:hypothetical protein
MGFALTTKAYTRLDMIDIDVNLGDAIANTSTFFGTTTVSSNTNQRVNGTAWGEVACRSPRNLYDDRMNRINAGMSLKICFRARTPTSAPTSFRERSTIRREARH